MLPKSGMPRRGPTLTPNRQNNRQNNRQYQHNRQNNHQNDQPTKDLNTILNIIKLSSTTLVEAIDKLIGLQRNNNTIYNYDNRTHLPYNQEAAARKRAHMRSPTREEIERTNMDNVKTDKHRYDREPEIEPLRNRHVKEEYRLTDSPSHGNRERGEERGRTKRNKQDIEKQRFDDVSIGQDSMEPGIDDVSSRRSSTSVEELLGCSRKLLHCSRKWLDDL